MNRYEFDVNNENMYGHWVDLFSNDNESTKIDFTENVTPKKIFFYRYAGFNGLCCASMISFQQKRTVDMAGKVVTPKF